jgi:hypothetical protein
MKKPFTFKRILKIIAGIIIFFTLPTALLFGYVYFKYNEDLPISKPSLEADVLAKKMLDALDYNAYKNTDYIEFTFKSRHHYKWNKLENTCQVYWKYFQVNLDLSNTKESTVLINKQAYNSIEKEVYIEKALDYFNNDSFWLVAPYKVFDKNTTRAIAENKAGEKGLLITYNSGGSTPGDSYLWHLDETNKPKSFQMWTSILPIQGFPASWDSWTTTETGANLPTFHKLGVLGLDITGLKTKNDTSIVYYPSKKSINSLKMESSIINLNDLKNFNHLIESVDSLRLENKYPIIDFKLEDKNYKIRNFQASPNTIDCYKCKDVLEIHNTDIYKCDKLIGNINEGYRIFEKFYLDNENGKSMLINIDTEKSMKKT